MQNLLKYGATVITLPTCRSAIRAATSCNKEDQPMTSPRPLKVDNQITFRLSAEIHEFQGQLEQLGSKRSLFPGHQGFFRDPQWFSEERGPEEPCAKTNLPCQLRAVGATSHGARRIRSRKCWAPNFWGPRMMKSSIQQLGVGDPISFLISCLHLRSLGLWGCKLI